MRTVWNTSNELLRYDFQISKKHRNFEIAYKALKATVWLRNQPVLLKPYPGMVDISKPVI